MCEPYYTGYAVESSTTSQHTKQHPVQVERMLLFKYGKNTYFHCKSPLQNTIFNFDLK